MLGSIVHGELCPPELCTAAPGGYIRRGGEVMEWTGELDEPLQGTSDYREKAGGREPDSISTVVTWIRLSCVDSFRGTSKHDNGVSARTARVDQMGPLYLLRGSQYAERLRNVERESGRKSLFQTLSSDPSRKSNKLCIDEMLDDIVPGYVWFERLVTCRSEIRDELADVHLAASLG